MRSLLCSVPDNSDFFFQKTAYSRPSPNDGRLVYLLSARTKHSKAIAFGSMPPPVASSLGLNRTGRIDTGHAIVSALSNARTRHLVQVIEADARQGPRVARATTDKPLYRHGTAQPPANLKQHIPDDSRRRRPSRSAVAETQPIVPAGAKIALSTARPSSSEAGKSFEGR